MRVLNAQARNPYARQWLWIPGSLAKASRPGMTELERINPTRKCSNRESLKLTGFPQYQLRHEFSDIWRSNQPKSVATGGHFMKWIIISLLGILAGVVMFGEAIAKIATWLRD